MTSVLICEDHPEVRDRLAAVLATLRGGSRIKGCGTASSEVLAHYNARTSILCCWEPPTPDNELD
jgi:hypothetical protein